MIQDGMLIRHYQHADKMMLLINVGLFLYSLALAFWYNTFQEAFIIGGLTIGALFGIYNMAKGSAIARASMAAGMMIATALHVHQTQGMIEMHFGIFALLAMLLYYRDWLPIVVAAVVIAVHHFLFYYLQTSGSSVWVLRDANGGFGVILLHAGYVVAETALLIWFAVNLKKESIQSMEILGVTNNAIGTEQVDLTLRTSGSTDLLNRFDSYTVEVENLAREVKQHSEHLNVEGNALASITDEMQQASSDQQRETDLIATAIEEMTAAIQEVSNNAGLASESSHNVDQNAFKATKVSERTKDAVEKLAEQVSKAVDTIENLHTQTESIGSVLDVIRGVAEQTNLLALNAAIEAARAGDQGRGFAVVADEVRTLAQRTQQSTEEIDSMIEKLQSGSKTAVEVIEDSRNQAVNCVENTQESLDLMEQVCESVKGITEMNELIATSTTQQSQVIEEVSKNVSNILDATSRAFADSEQAATGASTLRTIAGNLNTLAQRFKVT